MTDTKKCWFTLVNSNVKVLPDIAIKYGIKADKCAICKYIIVSELFQQSQCGTRYCQDCYNEMAERYFCDFCKIDDPDNFIHNKKEIFPDKALKKDLEKLKVNCPDCSSEMKILDLENHVKKECGDKWTQCRKCNEMVKPALIHSCDNSLSSRTNQSNFKSCPSCGKECLNLEDHQSVCYIDWRRESCPYGCSSSANLEQHRLDKSLFHLDKLWATLHSHGFTEIQNENTDKFKQWVKPIVDNLRTSLGVDVDRIGQLTEELSSLNKTVKEEIEIYDSIKNSLRSQISDSLYTSFDGTILWKIENFNDIKSKAVNGEQKSIFSPPFYTSRFGYKMCLRLYPNGDMTASGVAMSLFLVLMKGNYDSLLTWPFKQKVTFILLDQEFKTNMIDAFVPSENLTSFNRPRTDMNIPSGSSYFIKFEDMKPHKYVKDNTIFIRCIIDCSDLHE